MWKLESLVVLVVLGQMGAVLGGVGPTEPDPPPLCPVDLVVILDESSSINRDQPQDNYELMTDFVEAVASVMPLGSQSRIAVIEYGSPVYAGNGDIVLESARLRISLDENVTNAQFTTKIGSPELDCECNQNTQWTHTWDGLDMAFEHFQNYSRPGVKRVVMLLTDGVPHEYLQKRKAPDAVSWTDSAADQIKNDGIVLITVGLGVLPLLDEDYIKSLATNEQHAFQVYEWTELGELFLNMSLLVCDEEESGTPVPTAAPTFVCIEPACPDPIFFQQGWTETEQIMLTPARLPDTCGCQWSKESLDCLGGEAVLSELVFQYTGVNCDCGGPCDCVNGAHTVVTQGGSIDWGNSLSPRYVYVVERDWLITATPSTLFTISALNGHHLKPSLTIEIYSDPGRTNLLQTIELKTDCSVDFYEDQVIGTLQVIDFTTVEPHISPGGAIKLGNACPGLNSTEHARVCQQACEYFTNTTQTGGVSCVGFTHKLSNSICELYHAIGPASDVRPNQNSGRVCSTSPPVTPAPTPAPTCNRVMDLMIVIDESSSITRAENDTYNKVLQFVDGLLDSLTVSPTDTRVGILEFGSPFYTPDGFVPGARLATGFSGNEAFVRNTLANLECECDERTQYTHMWEGLDLAREVFNLEARNGVDLVTLLITDGVPFRIDGAAADQISLTLTSTAAHTLRASGVKLVTLGVGHQVNEAFMASISSKPGYFTPATDYDSLSEVRQDIGDAICDPFTPDTPIPTSSPTVCENAGCSSNSPQIGGFDDDDASIMPRVKLSELPQICGCTWADYGGCETAGNENFKPRKISFTVATASNCACGPVGCGCDFGKHHVTFEGAPTIVIGPPPQLYFSYIVDGNLIKQVVKTFGESFYIVSLEEFFDSKTTIVVSLDAARSNVLETIVFHTKKCVTGQLAPQQVGWLNIDSSEGIDLHFDEDERKIDMAPACPGLGFDDRADACQKVCTHFKERNGGRCRAFTIKDSGTQSCFLYEYAGTLKPSYVGRKSGGPCQES